MDIDKETREALAELSVSDPGQNLEVSCAVLGVLPPHPKRVRDVQRWEQELVTTFGPLGFVYVETDYKRDVVVIRLKDDLRLALYLRSLYR